MGAPAVPASSRRPLHLALKLTHRFVNVFYIALSALLILATPLALAVVHRQSLPLSRAIPLYVGVLVVAVAAVALFQWRRRVVAKRIVSMHRVLRTDKSADEMDGLLHQLDGSVKLINARLQKLVSEQTPLLETPPEAKAALNSKLQSHPVMRAYRMVEVIFNTAGFLSVAVPAIISIVSSITVSVQEQAHEAVILDVTGVATGVSGPVATILVGRRVLNYMRSAIRTVIWHEANRIRDEVVEDVKDDVVEYVRDQLDDYLPFLAEPERSGAQ